MLNLNLHHLRLQRALLLLTPALILALCSGCTKELRRSRHLSRGDQAFKEQKFDVAEIEYLKVLQAVPLEPNAVRQLGLLYQQQGKVLNAGRFLMKALETDTNNAELRVKLALCELELGDNPRAAHDAELALKSQPGHPEALEIFASTALSSNGLPDIQNHLEKFREPNKDTAAYHVALGTLQLRTQNLTNSETEFKKALALDPKCASASLGLGTIYLARKDLKAAEEAFKNGADASPVRSPRRLKYAEFKYATGKQDEARKYVEQITKEAPDYLPALDYLAQLAFYEKKYDDCESLVSRVLTQDPYNSLALRLSGNVKMAKGDGPGAVAVFSRMATTYGRMPWVHFQLARAYLMNNDAAKAAQSLNQAITLDPNYADAIILLANLNVRRNDPKPAITALSSLVKREPRLAQAYLSLTEAYLADNDPAGALTTCRSMAAQFPSNAQVQVVLGSVLARQNQLAEARKAYESALVMQPKYPAATEKLIELDLAAQQYPAAVQRAQQLIDDNPTASEAWVIMGQVHVAAAQGAVRAANTAASPGSPALRLADVASAQPEIQQAEAAFLKASQMAPGSRQPCLFLAELYAGSGKQQKALETLNNFLAKTNDVAALMQVGMIQEGLTNYTAAADAYKKLLAVDPNYGAALNNLAFIYAERMGDLDSGYKLAEKAHQLRPKDPSIADTYGWMLYKKGDYLHALEAIKQSASSLSNDPEIQFHLGMTEYALGNEEAATSALRVAAESKKDFSGKDKARLALRVLAIDPKTASATDTAELQKALEQNSHDPAALIRLGAIQERDGALDKAVETYQAALKYTPQNANLAFKLAKLYGSPRFNDPQKALALAKNAHELAPDNAEISGFLGQLVYKNGDYKWSASLLEDSAHKLPDDPQISYDLAWSYYSIGRVADSKSLMEKLATGNSDKAGGAKRFLSMAAAANDSTAATASAQDAQRAVSEDSGYVPALMVLATAAEAKGDYAKAQQTYNQVLTRFPLFTPATRNLGLLYFSHLNDDQKAYDLVLKAREALPQDADVAKALGVLTYRKGNYSRAAQLLQESAQSRKDDAELLYYLGMAEYQLKAKPESKAALQKALTHELPTKLAEDARRVLAELK